MNQELKRLNSIKVNENTNNNNNHQEIKDVLIVKNEKSIKNDNQLLSTRRKELYYTLLALQAHQNSYPNRKQGLVSIPFRFISKTLVNADKFVRNYEYPNATNLDFHNHQYYKNNFIASNDYSEDLKWNFRRQNE